LYQGDGEKGLNFKFTLNKHSLKHGKAKVEKDFLVLLHFAFGSEHIMCLGI
jgi:hypothetical protein